ncbi:DUF4236 domain-containing protein [Nitrincola sp. A-D6]|uniref:DUF4236 domain-containing protein n=1 Tax=Nitrincola sp. A-D6 TaxID=1545442 RepID=UPI001184A8DB|nr:DUF4236 domain-containing protein [Nitrincola sp. A-D6]
MAFRFRHSIRVVPGVRLKSGKRGITLSDTVRAQALYDHDQSLYGNITMPSAGLTYRTRFDNSRAHQHRAFQRKQQQKQRELLYTAETGQFKSLRIDPKQLRVTLSDQGGLQLMLLDGRQLTDEEMSTLWDAHPQLLRGWLDEQAALINGDIAEYIDLYQEAPAVDTKVPCYLPAAFPDPEPLRPDLLKLPAEPVYPQPPAVRLWHRLIPGRQQQLVRAHQQAVHEWQTAKLRWKAETHQARSAADRARQRYKAYTSVWKARKAAHDTEQSVYAEQFVTLLMTDEGLMTEVLIAELEQLDWPRETLVDFQLDLDRKQVWLDLDLPVVDSIPLKSAQVASGGQSLQLKSKSEAQRDQEYARYTHGVVFRLLGVLLASLPAIDEIIISGYTQRTNQQTGFEQDEYLLSVRVQRQAFSELNFAALDQLDPVIVLAQFIMRREMDSDFHFSAIKPFEPGQD